jgi:ABC-type dipeptide/oligopeptide/nickel transport system permease subunit
MIEPSSTLAPPRQREQEALYLYPSRRRRQRNGRLVVGLAIVTCVVLLALAAPLFSPHDPLQQNLLARRQPPSLSHPFGLDELGRDNLSRVIYGARLSLAVGVFASLLAVAVGGMLGTLAGYRSGWLDSAAMGVMDVILAFPTLLLAIAVVAVFGRRLPVVIFAVAFAAIPIYARLARVSVLTTKQCEHVVASRAVGASGSRLLTRHILPNAAPPMLAQFMLGIGIVILEVAGLSFLGLGMPPPTPEWGAMIGQGRGAVFSAPHIVLFPGLALMVTVVGFNLLGDGLRDALDPQLR